MVLAGLVLGVTVGAGTYLLERQRIAAAIEERATLAIELLRTSVRQLVLSTGEPSQLVVPQALAGLASDIPATELGRFAFVEVLDVDGHSLATVEDASLADLITLAKQSDFKADARRFELSQIRGGLSYGVVAIAVPVTDRGGGATR